MERPLLEFSLYWKFMCTDKNNDQNKTKQNPVLLSTPDTVFVIGEELLNP